ncbi:MAG TPA: hypothetical protein VKI41_07705 [Vicinamibacteria bacterium]|nr:hypothetical protein [Vicinamibacteria bacterium]
MALLLLAVTCVVVWLLLAPYADLRTDRIRQKGLDPALSARGREVLLVAARAHGLEAWRRHRSFEATAVDSWPSGSPWWPGSPQRFHVQRRLGTFTSRVELLDGARQGEIWGIQSWASYKRRGPTEARFAPDRAIEFYLPTLQYFDELPFRMLAAPVILYAGEGHYLGTTYQRVFVTWGSPAPHAEHDQYVLWINPASSLIDVVRYTLRDAVPLSSPFMRPLMKVFAAGTIHYRAYRRQDGVMISFEQTVTLPPPEEARPPLEENYFHRIVLESARFDGFDPELLTADPARPEVGDAKP